MYINYSLKAKSKFNAIDFCNITASDFDRLPYKDVVNSCRPGKLHTTVMQRL